MSSESNRSSVGFALRPPDPGQLAIDERVRAMSPAERAEHAYRLRRKALVLVNHAADAAGTMPELDRAIFVLRRLYPEFSDEQLAYIRADLATRQAAGRWVGFTRPSDSSGFLEVFQAQADNRHVHGNLLRSAFDSGDLTKVLDLLDEDVVWRGLPQPDGEIRICQSRDEVREVFVNYLEDGGTGEPIVVGEAGDSVVVDPQPQPALGLALHQVFTFRGGRVALMQDFPDRTSALQAVGLA